MMGVSSGCGLCPWSCSGKVGAYVLTFTCCILISAIKLSIFTVYKEIQDDNQTLVEPMYSTLKFSLSLSFPDAKAQIHSMGRMR